MNYEDGVKCSRYFLEEEDFSFHILCGNISNGAWEELEEELGSITSIIDQYEG